MAEDKIQSQRVSRSACDQDCVVVGALFVRSLMEGADVPEQLQ